MADIKCEREGEFLGEERAALREEFEKHRLEMEKELGRDVGEAEATSDFIEGNLEFCRRLQDGVLCEM